MLGLVTDGATAFIWLTVMVVLFFIALVITVGRP